MWGAIQKTLAPPEMGGGKKSPGGVRTPQGRGACTEWRAPPGAVHTHRRLQNEEPPVA